jgi:hypothetical protein
MQRIDDDMKPYVVVVRVRSSAHFKQGDSITLNGEGANGPARVIFATRLLDAGLNLPIPGDLWAEVSGHASNMQDAIDIYVNVALRFMSILALSANAAVDPVKFELAFDVDPRVSDHEFRQNVMLPPDQDFTERPRRRIDSEATTAMIKNLTEHPDRDRIWRAIDHYALALADWRFGHELVALEHLVVGMETLTKVAIRHHARATGETEEGLQKSLGIKSPETSAEMCAKCAVRLRGQVQYEFYSAVRREKLFKSDAETFRRAKEVSDGIEHGYSAFEAVYDDAKHACLPTASYLRTAILDLLGIDESLKRRLLEPRYAEPIGPRQSAKFISGRIRSVSGQLAKDGNLYPFIRVEKRAEKAEFTSDDRTRVHYNMTFTPVLSEGAQFIPATAPGADSGRADGDSTG